MAPKDQDQRAGLRLWLLVMLLVVLAALLMLEGSSSLSVGSATLVAGGAVGLFEFYRHVRPLRRKVGKLAEGERLYRMLVEEQDELVTLADEDLNIVYANPAYCRQFGLQEGEWVGKSICELVGESEQEIVKAAFAEMVVTKEPMRGLSRVALPDGQEGWIAWMNLIKEQPDGTVIFHSVGRDVTKRKHAEAALKASEGFLARTGRIAGVGGWEVDVTTGRLECSDQVRRIFEAAPKLELTYDSLAGFLSSPESLARAMDLARAAGTPFDLELQAHTATQRPIWVRVVGEVERDEAGRIERLVGAFQDISARKQLEEQLATRERFIRNITENLPVRISYIDRELKYQFVNAEQLRRLNTTREDALGRTRAELLDLPAGPAVMEKIEAALEGVPQHFEIMEDVNGETRYVQCQFIPDQREDGRVEGLYTTGVDITALKATELRLRELSDIVEYTPDYIVQTDWKGCITYSNPAARRAVGLDMNSHLEGRHVDEFWPSETRDHHISEVIPFVKAHDVWVGETTLVTPARTVPVNQTVIAHRDTEGRVARFSSVMRDISQVLANRKALNEQTAALEAVVEAIPAMVAVYDAQLRVRLVNRAFERWRGRERGGVIGRSMAELFGIWEHERHRPWLQSAMKGETVSYETDYPEAAHHRHLSNSCVPLRLDDGSVVGVVLVAQDITQHRDEERRLHHLAARDSLTGVLNRSGFDSSLATRGVFEEIALLYIDLDRFKPVNDTYGHAVGDELLRQFAQRLQGLIRPTDVVARLGGDEFAVLLNDVRTKEAAEMVADKIVDAAQKPFFIEQHAVVVGASVGVAFGVESDGGWQDLLARADAAVYRAKASGRGRRG